MRQAVLIVVLAAGCVPAAKSPDEIEPLIAVAGTYGVISSSTTPPAPAPAPVQGDACPDCYGRGIVGDGNTKMKCQRCDGTGKVVKHPPVVIKCEDGKCQTPRSIAR